MKTGNIGIRNLADIGVADIDVYGTDKNKYEAFKKIEEVKFRIPKTIRFVIKSVNRFA